MRTLLTSVAAAVALLAVAPFAAQAASPSRPHAPAKPSAKVVKAAKKNGAARAHISSCAAQDLVGDWHNIDPNTRSMRRAIVDFNCGDVILCDIYGHCTGGVSSFYMHMYGACSPTSCDWGRLQATDMGGGWIRSIYNFGFASVHVWLKTYQYYGLTYLRVWTYTDFTPADGRTDYTTDEWMLK